MKEKMTAEALKTALEGNGCHPDLVVRKRDGTFRVVHSFYYRHGMNSKKWADNVFAALTKARIACVIEDYFEHYHGFVGGAKTGSSQDSYFETVVRLN